MAVSKRLLVVTAAVSAALVMSGCSGGEPDAGGSSDEGVVLTFAAPGGAVGDTFAAAADLFEDETGIKVELVEGATNEIYAQVLAQRADPLIDVLMTSPSTAAQGAATGLFLPVSEELVPNIADLYEATPAGEFDVPIQVAAEGFAYNTEEFEKNGIPPFESLDDLENPKLNGRVAINQPKGNFGIHALMMFAFANGGDIDNVEPGFEKMKELQESGNWALTPASTAESNAMLSQGSAWVAYTSTIHASTLRDQGLPIQFVAPEPTGGFINLSSVAVVNGTDHEEAAFKWVNFLLSPQVQTLQAYAFVGPTNKTVELSEEVAASVPYGEEEVGALLRPDDIKVAELSPGWVEQWNQILGTY